MKKLFLIGLLLAATKIYSQSITTNAATYVTQTTATLNATASGLTSSLTYVVRFQWATTSGSYSTTYFLSDLLTGSTSYSVSFNITGLTMNTAYKCRTRIYLWDTDNDELGAAQTVYNESNPNFTTLNIVAPSITTTAATSITTSSATIGGNVTADGGASVTERGMTLSIADNTPTLGESNVVSFVNGGTGTGVFTLALVNLKPGQIYYYNSYAINSVDTAYGTATNFTTTSITQASNIAFNNTTSTQSGITFTAGGGTGRLVLAKQGASITTVPTDGADYTGGSNTFGSGTNIGDNTYVIAQGNITSMTLYGLSVSTTYYIQVYEYTSNGGGGYYYQPTPAANNVTTIKGEPTTQATNVSFSSVLANSLTTTWARGNGDGVIVIARASGAVNDFPDDGTTYSASATFGSGTQLGTGNYVIYIGTGTSVNLSGLTDGTYYEIRAFEYNNSGTNINYKTSTATNNPNNTTTPGIFTWQGDDGTSPSYWNVAANWDKNTLPTSASDVIIPTSAPVMPEIFLASYACTNLTIEADASLTINDGRTLTVNGNLLLKTPAGSGAAGQLVIPGTGALSVSGTSTMERYYLNTNNWRYVSSPLTSPSIAAWTGFYANAWNASTQSWNHLTLSSGMSVMQGISVVDSLSDKTITFTGTFNNGDQSRSVTNTGGGENFGWNLVGNPYPSAIDWGAGTGITRTNVDAAAYLYNSSAGTYDPCTGSPCVIAAGQGFFVHTDPSGSLAFTNACRIASSQTFRKNGVIEQPKIELEAKNDVYTTKAFVLFEPNATSNYDSEYDAFKLMSPNESISDIYTITSNGTKLAINALNFESINSLPENGLIIPIGLTTGINGIIELSAAEITNLPQNMFIYLHDKQLDKYSNLRDESYKLQISNNTDTRFELLLTQTAVSNKEVKYSSPDIFIYTSNKTTFIKSTLFEQNKGELEVFDIMGRLILKQYTENTNLQEIYINNPGTYIIKFIVNNSITTQKVVVE